MRVRSLLSPGACSPTPRPSPGGLGLACLSLELRSANQRLLPRPRLPRGPVPTRPGCHHTLTALWGHRVGQQHRGRSAELACHLREDRAALPPSPGLLLASVATP